jgi:hypothetical protein
MDIDDTPASTSTAASNVPNQPHLSPHPTSNMPLHSVSLDLLSDVRRVASTLPGSVPAGVPRDDIAWFSLHITPLPGLEDQWEFVDRKLNTFLGSSISKEALEQKIRRGKLGVSGLCDWLEFFTRNHGVEGMLLKPKMERLMDAMNSLYVPFFLFALSRSGSLY